MRLDWRGVLGIGLSAVALWWVLRGADLHQIYTVLAASNAWLWLACTFFATLIFPLRARRWQALLAPTYGRLPVADLWKATAIGMMVNNVAPFRAGEIARPFALTRLQPQVQFMPAFASLAVDRLFDGTMVFALMLLATLDPAFPRDQLIGGKPLSVYLVPTSVFLGVVLAGALMLLFAPRLTSRIAAGVVGTLAPKLAPRVVHLLSGFVRGLEVLRTPSLFAEVFWWTLLHWLCNAFAFWLGFRALGIAAPFSAALMLQGLIAIAVAAPSSPGFFGFFEASAVVGLALYGIHSEEAVAWGLGFHILSYIPITVIGVWYLTRLKIHFADFRVARTGESPAHEDTQAPRAPG
ncbi:MAG: flippase-like domain-containing protein [Gemmatimonadetes bacterium]|nr:flippase-like domain-containing protein [Gemmatimonadota bacterium]